MTFYSSILYGSGNFYGPGSLDVPRDLRFYRTNVDNVYTFHWGFDESFITPMLSTADFDLQLDTVTTFDSLNLVTFTSSTVISYQNGNVRKGFTVPVSPRLDGVEQTWYARARTRIGFNTSGWSLILPFTILQKFEVHEAENLITNLPDKHVYGKEDLLKPVAIRNTNLYTVMNTYARELDQVELENILTSTNNYINICRDEVLYDNFGKLFSYTKPQIQQFVEYRESLRALILGSLVGGTIDAVERVIRSFTGVTPFIELIRDRNDFFLTTEFETPPETPDSFITHFSTSADYIPNSLVVIKNGLIQSPTTYTEDHTGPNFGFDFLTPPVPGDIIQVFFEIGVANDPTPIVFDLTDTTSLTGVLTFTNNSFNVTGSGTLFIAELTPGMLIVDSSGLVFGEVESITNNLSLTLTQKWIGSTSSGSSAKLNFNDANLLTGIVTFTNGNTSVTGINTLFLSELHIGDTITDNAGLFSGVVDIITNNTQLTLVNNWTGSTGVNTQAKRLGYGEMINWDKSTLAYGVIIHVLNPGNFAIDENLIETLVRPLIGAQVISYFDFV